MGDPDIQLICKYNSTTYENAFHVMHSLIFERFPSQFALERRGADKVMLVGAKSLDHYFKQVEQEKTF